MVEPIEIFDSPPPPALRPVTNRLTSRPTTRDTDLNLWPTDDFDDTFKGPWDNKPAKRRKISTVMILETTESYGTLDQPFRLSDTEDTIPTTKVTRTRVRVSQNLHDYDDDDDDYGLRTTTSKRVQRLMANIREDPTSSTAIVLDEDPDGAPGSLNSSQQTAAPMRAETGDLLVRLAKRTNSCPPSRNKRGTKESTASPKRSK